MVITSLDDLVNVIAERVADCIAARDPALIDQRDARGLKGRRHIDAVRRRMSEKAGGAFCKGRDYLLTPTAVREELERLSRFAVAAHPDAPVERRKAGPVKGKAPKASARDEMAKIKRELETDMRRAREKS